MYSAAITTRIISLNEKNHDGVCPITGQPCHFHKQIHITEITPDGIEDLHVCPKCGPDVLVSLNSIKNVPKQKPEEIHPAVLVANTVLGILNLFAQAAPRREPPDGLHPCPECGWTVSTIRSSGRLGCPSCWRHFAGELRPLLEAVHGSTTHVGKRPKTKEVPQDEPKQDFRKGQLERLQQKLAAAIEEERYEEAAIIRDTIAQIKVNDDEKQTQ